MRILHLQLMLSTQQLSRIRVIAVTGLLILCGFRIVTVISYAANVLPLGGDARSYIAAAQAIMHGQAPIGANGERYLPEAGPDIPVYLYPPFLALVMIPLANLPYPISLYIWLILVAAMTLLLIPLLQRLVGWKAAILGVLFFLPTWESLWLGQINAMIAIILMIALLALTQRQDVRLGFILAIGTLLKVTPALSILILIVHQRWRSVIIASVTTLSIIAMSLPFISLDMWYTGSLYALTSTWTSPLLLSWTAILRRQTGLIGTIGPTVLTIGMLFVTILRSRHLPPRLSLTATFILPLLISGIIWHYSALIVLPALAALWQYSRKGRLIAFTTWTVISLIGGILQPIVLSLCWCVCCWPKFLGTDEFEPSTRLDPARLPETSDLCYRKLG